MPSSLRNAGSTYQRMATQMFESQIGRNVKAYINDMAIKSRQVKEHLADLGEVVSVLKEHKLRLKASKCSFGVSLGKFLGYMITHQGIEVNPNQIKAISSLHPPRNPKEVQKLIGMATTLNRFISRSTNRCRPFSNSSISGRTFNGPMSVWWPLRNSSSIFQAPQSFLGPRKRKCCMRICQSQIMLLV